MQFKNSNNKMEYYTQKILNIFPGYIVDGLMEVKNGSHLKSLNKT